MNTEYLPIDDYGAIGNDDRCALVGSDGSIDWCCFPHVESPSVFAAILDTTTGGRFLVQPTAAFESQQRYKERTNVLETTFETESGTATVTDFMPIREGTPSEERFQQAIYRRVEGVDGSLEFQVHFEPRFDYARASTEITIDEYKDAVALGAERNDDWPTSQEREVLYLHATPDFELDADANAAVTSMTVDDETDHWFCLQYGGPFDEWDRECEGILEDTIEYWQSWVDTCEETGADIFSFDEEWRPMLIRSALVLKLLIHEETGAIPAAPTTSLPEEIGGSLNWDYRYNWIRDAKFTVQALHSVGQDDEANSYFEWFREIGHENPAEIQPLYGLHSETDLEETTLDHLDGYRDSQPVRIGNAAATQQQLDIYGTIVQGIYETIRYENGLTDKDWASVRALADYVCDHWDEKDKSIWEFRDLHAHFVHSKLLCWVALDRALRLATVYDREAPIDRWKSEREAIRTKIEDRGYDEDAGSFLQFFDADNAIDATALLIPLYDFLPAEDDRVQNTIDTVLDELTSDDGLVVRFANSPARPREPGGFLICSFWLVDALALSGRMDEARSIFESLIDHTSSLGLLSEMIHTDDGTFLGNYPQAFSHIGLLNSAFYLASASDDVGSLPPEETINGQLSPLFQRHDS